MCDLSKSHNSHSIIADHRKQTKKLIYQYLTPIPLNSTKRSHLPISLSSQLRTNVIILTNLVKKTVSINLRNRLDVVVKRKLGYLPPISRQTNHAPH